MKGGFRGGFGHGRKGCVAGGLGEIGGWFLSDFLSCWRLVLGGKEGGGKGLILVEEEEENWVALVLWIALSLGWQKGCGRRGLRLDFNRRLERS